MHFGQTRPEWRLLIPAASTKVDDLGILLSLYAKVLQSQMGGCQAAKAWPKQDNEATLSSSSTAAWLTKKRVKSVTIPEI